MAGDSQVGQYRQDTQVRLVTSIDKQRDIMPKDYNPSTLCTFPSMRIETMLLDINAPVMLEVLHVCTLCILLHLYVLVVLLLAVDLHGAVPVELNSGGQAGDLLVVLGHDVGGNGVLSRRDLLRQLDVLGQGQLALLDRALEVGLLDGVAQVGGLSDDGDQAVLDGQVHLGPVYDIGGQVAAGDDGEDLTAAIGGQWVVRAGVAMLRGLTPWAGWGSGRHS
jgi:hypothetical protein